MAHAQSHKIEYKDRAGIDTLIEIWDEGYVGAITEGEASEDPLVVDIAPMDPTIFTPVIGTGATIGVFSVTDGQYLGMYTKDPKKKMVKIFKDNKANPWWLGYVNTEQYGEDYSMLENYQVSINCNNGFNILNRFKYLDGFGNMYIVPDTKWTILTRILAKAGLPYQYVYFGTRISCTGVVVGAGETLFHQLKANQLNYYDEEDEPMTYRQVLEHLLASYGLQIRQEQGSIFIYEPSMLAEANWSARRYNGTTYAYIDTVNVSANFDISNGDINWDNEDAAFDTTSGFSKQKIRYSPYMHRDAIEEVDLADRDLWTGVEAWANDAWGVARLSGITAVKNFLELSLHAHLGGHRKDAASEEEIYFEKTIDDEGGVVTLTEAINKSRRVTGIDNGQYLMFECEVFIRSKADEYGTDPSVMARSIRVPFYARVGDKGATYNGGTGVYDWADGNGDERIAYIGSNFSDTICDKWHKVRAYIPWNLPGGVLSIVVNNPRIYLWYSADRLYAADGLISTRLRNFKVSIYKDGGCAAGGLVLNSGKGIEVSDDDALYTITLDEEFINEGTEMTLYHGDAINITDRGGILKNDNSFTSAWSKTGDVSTFRLIDLLLRSIASQYQNTLDTLTGTLEADALMGVNGGPVFLHTIQDTDYLGTPKLMFTGGAYNDFDRTINGTWLEVKQEDVTITVS